MPHWARPVADTAREAVLGSRPVIRIIRLLGAALGLLVGLTFVTGNGGPFSDSTYAGALIAAWLVAWLVVGFAGLPFAKRNDLIAATEAIGLFRRPAPEEPPRANEPQVAVDTSAIIDGRIADIAEAGFLQGTLVVSRVVLDELQRIADNADTLRRNRGRRGLEILSRLQKDARVNVEIVEDTFPEIAEVDAKLVALARSRSGVILTNDFNLNRVAEIQGVRVMNVNLLANALKPAVLPGEDLRVRVIQEGKEAGQGVGFLDDGTMIVVEGGARHLDREIDVGVTRVLQTVAGRMIFALPKPE